MLLKIVLSCAAGRLPPPRTSFPCPMGHHCTSAVAAWGAGRVGRAPLPTHIVQIRFSSQQMMQYTSYAHAALHQFPFVQAVAVGGLGVGAMAVSLFLKPAAEGAKGGWGHGAMWMGWGTRQLREK